MRYITILIFLSIQSVYPQTAWQWINPLPAADYLSTAQFFNSNTGYVCGRRGAFLKTTNGGNSWNISRIDSIYIDYPSMHFANRDTGFIYYYDVFRTTDAGASWNRVFFNEPSGIYAIKFHNGSTGIALAGDTSICYRSTNAGSSWSRIDIPGGYYFFDINTDSTGNYYIIGSDQDKPVLMKSINSGLNWSIIDLNYKDSLYINRIRIPSPNIIYISSGDTPAKLFRTTNGGVNWNMSGFDNIEALTDFEFSDELHGAACGYGGFRYFTVDGGLNWTSQRLPDTTKFILDICLAGDTYINTGGTGWIERSTNCGINWISLSSNFTSDRLNSVSFGDKETGLITGNSSTILRTTNRGLNWQKIELKDPQVLTDVKMASKNIAYLTSGNNVMKSTNGGMNWFVVLDSVGRGYRNIALCDSNNVIVSTFNFLYKTSNGGASWSLVWGCYNLPPFYTSCFFINEISYPAADLIVMAGGTAQQYTYSSATVMKSTNGGLNFTIAFDEVSEGYVLNSLQMIDENLGFASGGFGLFLRTTDGFSTYTNLGNTKNGYGSFEMISFLDSANGLAGTGPLFRTTNSGINWELSTDIYGSLGDIQYISKDHAIAVGYDGSIVIMAPALNGTGDPPVIPNRFYLYQNFPNPFNPATKIRFELVESGNTTLILYDITGREVRVLLNGFRAAGIYQTEHVFDDLASGVYFVTLRQGSYTMSRKLALIK